jgi:FkbM family methyltransferase
MKKFYSQYKQDEWLYNNHFKNKNNGFFLEIGADDGVDKSNTKFFEELGWAGMCIEASPKRFKLLKNNRTCICENYAVSDTVGEVKFMDISGWGKGLSGIIDAYDDKHRNRIENEIKHPLNNGREIITLNTELLSNLLDKHGINEIDFCTIDIEGGEYDILKTIDFKKYNINIIIVENNYNDPKVGELLTSNGYKKIHKLTIDDVYLKNN